MKARTLFAILFLGMINQGWALPDAPRDGTEKSLNEGTINQAVHQATRAWLESSPRKITDLNPLHRQIIQFQDSVRPQSKLCHIAPWSDKNFLLSHPWMQKELLLHQADLDFP